MLLTLDLLKRMEPGEVFRVVTTKYQTLHESGNAELTFVCKRGGIHDWAIYGGYSYKGAEWILHHGQKVGGKQLIKSLVPCDEEALSMYRF